MSRRLFYFIKHEREPEPNGGMQVALRHVDLLNKLGFEAWIVLYHKDFKFHQYLSNWYPYKDRTIPVVYIQPEKQFLFNFDTPLKTLREDKIVELPPFTPQDILILPLFWMHTLSLPFLRNATSLLYLEIKPPILPSTALPLA